MNYRLPAVVAAAGLSSRMGASKALLDAGGGTFLARVVGALNRGGGDPVLVVLRSLEGEEAREADACGSVPILNPDPGPGPISSLQAGLRNLPSDAPGTLFTPVDHPLFKGSTVKKLITGFLDALPPIAAPAFHGRPGHPVIFHQDLFPELLEEDLPQGARTVVRRHLEGRLLLDVDDPGVLADIDTPLEYRRHFPAEPNGPPTG